MTVVESAPLLTQKILDYIVEDLLGTGIRHETVSQDAPKNMFPAGNLGPKSLVAQRMGDFRQTEFTPSSIGFVFRFRSGQERNLDISGRVNIFFPLHPTLDELREIAANWEESIPRNINWDDPTPEHLRTIEGVFVKFRPKYVRHTVRFSSILRSRQFILDNKFHGLDDSTRQIETEIDAARQRYLQHLIPLDRKGNPPSEVPIQALMTQKEFDAFFSKFSNNATPVWKAKTQYRAWEEPGGIVSVELLLSNDITEEETRKLPRLIEPHLFAPTLQLRTPPGFVVPYELEVLRSRDYRADPFSPGLGINCDLRFQRRDGLETLSSEILPVYRQLSSKPGELQGYPEGTPTFEQLATDPIPHLKAILMALEAYKRKWELSFDDFVRSGILKPEQREDFHRAVSAFDEEVNRYRLGVDALSDANTEDLLTAFKLMNEAMVLQSKARPTIRAWRLFQIVFIVSNLPDILIRERSPAITEPTPSVLWYATGGGKTEAYLGLAVAHAFWDRLRGKSFGVTAWCKFPLRLLSMQQLSRISHMIAYAEQVRASTPSIPTVHKGDPFSVGLFAGESNSVNFLDWPPDASKETELSFEAKRIVDNGLDPSNPWIRRNRKVDRCPICPLSGRSGQIVTSFDPSVPKFHHVCARCGYRLNLHVSDTETLRYLPTVVVGTIDKLAALGRVPSTKVFFGYARRKCSVHGYLLRDDEKCPVLSCGKPAQRVDDVRDPTPSLLIQDELHFLRETLGAFDSHYETMTFGIMREAARELAPRMGPGWKVVGSTATIEGYGEQIRQLYAHRSSIRFPVAGPLRGTHFYASEDPTQVQRFVLGFRPQNMSHIDAVMKVLLSFHRFTLPLAEGDQEAWEALGDEFAALSDSERKQLALRYRTSLAYALTRAECGQINKSFIRQLNPVLVKLGLPEFEEQRVRNLTGEMDSDDVQGTLNDLENPQKQWIQAITATSMVSHGVDLDVLNFITFRGQPHTISEWIQAMSRVGRAKGFPGIVVNVYNPNRERDASYFRHHIKFIEHAGALIRLVPITRFSRTALAKTAPGLFFNALSYFAAPPDLLYVFREQLKRRFPSIRARILELMRAYLDLDSDDLDPKERRLLQELENQLERIQAVLESPTSPDKTLDAIEPMTSLRDVDIPVQIVPDYDYDRFSPRRGKP